VVGGAEFAGERGFRTFLIVIEYVNVKAPQIDVCFNDTSSPT
jgi:hypothetical protein